MPGLDVRLGSSFVMFRWMYQGELSGAWSAEQGVREREERDPKNGKGDAAGCSCFARPKDKRR